MFDLVLHGGTIISPQGKIIGDIAVKDGIIVEIARLIDQDKANKYIDLSGKLIFPGCIDSHMHLWEPGLIADYDFKDGTRASAAQGVTTVIDHPLTIPAILNADRFSQKIAIGEKTSYTDFALHGGVGIDNLNELEGLWEAGCTAFKIFMCDSGSEVAGLNSAQILNAFRTIGSFGGTVLLHCENEEILEYNKAKLIAENRTDPMAFIEWRPPIAELEAINRALFLLRDTGAKAVFLHTTLSEGVEMVNAEKRKGRDLWAETCAHNLYLSTNDLAEKGNWVTFAPPVRDPSEAPKLWKCINDGMIHTVGSDHSAADPVSKRKGMKNIWEDQFGVPDAETLVPLMLNAVAKKWITPEKMAEVLSANPAKIYGLYPKKGSISIGADADFTIADLNQEYTLKAENMYTACKWIPYEGMTVSGKVVYTILRGTIISENGKIVGEPGYGRFCKRNTNHSRRSK